MYVHIVGGTGSYATSTTNMYHKYFTYAATTLVPVPPVASKAGFRMCLGEEEEVGVSV